MSRQPSTEAELRQRVLDAVRREPALARPLALRRRARLIALGFAGTGLMALTRRWLEPSTESSLPAAPVASLWRGAAASGLPHRPLFFVLTLELVWLAVVVAATWAGLARGRSMLGRSRTTKLTVAILTPLALALSWLSVARAELAALDPNPGTLLHVHCALLSVAYAVGPLVAFFALRRDTDPLAPRFGGAAIGAVAGAWGALLYVVSCDCTSPLHMALAHVLPILLLALAGALVGERVLGLASAS